MEQKNKEILLKDLTARLPYGFVIHRESDNSDIIINYIDDFSHFLDFIDEVDEETFKPYLRPLDSMTEEELEELEKFSIPTSIINNDGDGLKSAVLFEDLDKVVDWFNSHHFDYRGLIEKGLALKAPEGIYSNKK